MGRMQVLRQGNLLALMEPGPALTPTIRATLVLLAVAVCLAIICAPVALGTGPGAYPGQEA